MPQSNEPQSMENDEMELISQVATLTKTSVDTIRWWGKQGLLTPWEQREIPGGYAYYTTVNAVLFRLANRPNRGRPIKPR